MTNWVFVLVVCFLIALVVILLLLYSRYSVKTKGKSVVLSASDETTVQTTDLASKAQFPLVLLQDDLTLKTELLTQAEFLTCSALFKEISSYRLPICTDDNGWYHYCYFVMGECFRTIKYEPTLFADEADASSTRDLILSKMFSSELTLRYAKFALADSTLSMDTSFQMHPNVDPVEGTDGLITASVLKTVVPIQIL